MILSEYWENYFIEFKNNLFIISDNKYNIWINIMLIILYSINIFIIVLMKLPNVKNNIKITILY